MERPPLLRNTSFEALPGWAEDDHAAAYAAFRRCALRALEKPYRPGSFGVPSEDFEPAYAQARRQDAPGPDGARAFFERYFSPALIELPDGRSGHVTGFYEPVVAASPVRTAQFAVPLLARPDDLAEATDGEPQYFDRAAIEGGALAGRGLEIAWLADPVDAFFIHVQGAARLLMPDGTTRRVTYSAKSGHPFTGPGRLLVEMGQIPQEEISMQAIRGWFRKNPGRINEILHRNRSYIFFREAPVDDSGLGPIAAAKVPLAPCRSIAVDRLLHTFGTPFFISAEKLVSFDNGPFRRLMIAQDTGSAIVGPARGDLFAGSGDAAGEIAGRVNHAADFFMLIPRADGPS